MLRSSNYRFMPASPERGLLPLLFDVHASLGSTHSGRIGSIAHGAAVPLLGVNRVQQVETEEYAA